MLKTEQLRCFVAAMREGSFTEAGKALNLSPSAVAYNVEALEDQLNAGLLIRKPASGVSATREGLRLLRMVDPLLAEMSEIEALFASKGKQLQGELVIGCQEGLSWSLAPRAIERLTARHRKLSVIQKTVFMDEGNEPVLSGHVDVLITFLVNPVPESGVDIEILCEPNSYALMRADHPLADRRDGAQLEELARYPHVFISDGPAFDLFTGMYHDKNLTPEFAMVSNISTAAQAIVGRCDSISLRVVKPAHNLSPLGDRLAFIPVINSSRHASVAMVSAKRKHGVRSPKIEAFANECRHLFKDGTMRAHLFYDDAAPNSPGDRDA